jgi:hypothetical protein
MISYYNYIKMLNEKNIELYDHQKRISYYKLSNLKNNNNNIMLGGGIGKTDKIDFDKLQNYQIEKIIFKVLNNEDNDAVDMIKYYNKL